MEREAARTTPQTEREGAGDTRPVCEEESMRDGGKTTRRNPD